MLTDELEETAPDRQVALDKKHNEKVINLAQDITAAVTSIQTPENVGLALHILKQNRNKDLVTMLNQFGNRMSYQDAQCYVSMMAAQADEQVSEDGLFILNSVVSGKFIQFAISNLDFHENTKDCKTMHGTTQGICQYVKFNDLILSF